MVWISINHAFKNVKEKIKLVPGIDLVCDKLEPSKKRFVKNREPSQTSVYTLKSACRCTFQHLEVNFINLCEMELTTDLTLPFLSWVNTYLCFFYRRWLYDRMCRIWQQNRRILSILVLGLSVWSNWMLRKLQDVDACFSGEHHISNCFIDKEKTYFEVGAINTDRNTWGEYFLKN